MFSRGSYLFPLRFQAPAYIYIYIYIYMMAGRRLSISPSPPVGFPSGFPRRDGLGHPPGGSGLTVCDPILYQVYTRWAAEFQEQIVKLKFHGRGRIFYDGALLAWRTTSLAREAAISMNAQIDEVCPLCMASVRSGAHLAPLQI
jgi:hypothetical protein